MFEAYKVAIKLSLVSNVASGLAALSTQFNKVNGNVKTTEASLTALELKLLSIKKLGLVGGAMTVAGGFGLSLFSAPLEAAKQYEMAHTRFKTLNLGAEVNKQADQFARGAQAFGASSNQLMEALRNSVGMFGDVGAAKEIAPIIAELNAANAALFGGKIGAIDDSGVRSIMRFNDMRGLTNTTEEFKRGLDLAQKMVTGSGGSIKFTDLELMAKRGGAAFKGLSDDGVMMLATVMQEQGGSATGTALMSLYQNLIAGRTTKKAMAALKDSGLAELGYVAHGDVGGKQYKTLQVTKIKGEELLRTNPGAWLMQYGVDAAKKSGAKNDSEVIAFMNNLISNRTASNLAATFTTQSLQAVRDYELAKNAMGSGKTINAFKDTAQGKIIDMQTKWNNLLAELGFTILPIAIKAVDGLTSVIKGSISFASEFPVLTKGLVIGFGALAGLVAAGGIVMLTVAALKALGVALSLVGFSFKALSIAALANPIGLAITAAIIAGWTLYKNWEEISSAVTTMWDLLKTGFIKLFEGDILGSWHSFAGIFLTSWQTTFNILISAINTILPKSWEFGKATFADDYNEKYNGKSRFISSSAENLTITPAPVILDGKQVTSVVFKQAGKEASRPPQYGSLFDPVLSFTPVSATK